MIVLKIPKGKRTGMIKLFLETPCGLLVYLIFPEIAENHKKIICGVLPTLNRQINVKVATVALLHRNWPLPINFSEILVVRYYQK